MSDFLSRVAARAAGTAETIQPRVWSRFETVPDEPSETSFVAAVAPRRDEPQSVPSSPLPQSPPPQSAPPQSAPPQSALPQSAPPPAPTLPQRFVEVDRIVERIVAPQLARRTETPQPPIVPNAPPPIVPAAAPQAQNVRPIVRVEPVERVIEQTVERVETRPEIVQRIVTYVPVSPIIETVVEPVIEPVIEPPIVPSAAAPQRMEGPRERVVMQPRILPSPLRPDRLPPVVRSRTIPPSHSATPSQPPAVHVSIGRVEVRATVAPERTHTPRPSPSPSPLDEYLRRRDKRGR